MKDIVFIAPFEELKILAEKIISSKHYSNIEVVVGDFGELSNLDIVKIEIENEELAEDLLKKCFYSYFSVAEKIFNDNRERNI